VTVKNINCSRSRIKLFVYHHCLIPAILSKTFIFRRRKPKIVFVFRCVMLVAVLSQYNESMMCEKLHKFGFSTQ